MRMREPVFDPLARSAAQFVARWFGNIDGAVQHLEPAGRAIGAHISRAQVQA